jgi:hypothetical protein
MWDQRKGEFARVTMRDTVERKVPPEKRIISRRGTHDRK